MNGPSVQTVQTVASVCSCRREKFRSSSHGGRLHVRVPSSDRLPAACPREWSSDPCGRTIVLKCVDRRVSTGCSAIGRAYRRLSAGSTRNGRHAPHGPRWRFRRKTVWTRPACVRYWRSARGYAAGISSDRFDRDDVAADRTSGRKTIKSRREKQKKRKKKRSLSGPGETDADRPTWTAHSEITRDRAAASAPR